MKYDIFWFDETGIHANGSPYDNFGFDRHGIHRETWTKTNHYGFERTWLYTGGVKESWYDNKWYDFLGFNKMGVNQEGERYTERWFDCSKKHKNWTYFDDQWNDRKWLSQQKSHIQPQKEKLLQLLLYAVFSVPLVWLIMFVIASLN